VPCAHIVRSTPVVKTPRLLQVEGIFDISPSEKSEVVWDVNFTLPEDWNVGVIVGPSGAGKSTVARELFGGGLADGFEWSHDKSVLDGFPEHMGIKDITSLLSSVGFSSPPSWVRPFHVLSNGEQFRVTMARTIAEKTDLAVVDEFTSVVDRTVAQIGSAAISRTVRKRGQKFVAVTCHYDVLDWLEPDWVYEPHTNRLARGALWRRPAITLTVQRVHYSAWELFRKHHYLDAGLNRSASCFVASWNGIPVAFSAWLAMPSRTPNLWRAHRTVCLPDFQGVGIGIALNEYCASMLLGMGKTPVSKTTNPAMIRVRAKSGKWRITRKPQLRSKTELGNGGMVREKGIDATLADTRMAASFAYIGPAMDAVEARSIWSGSRETEVAVQQGLVYDHGV
jgi:ABC-type lipoprotein export system ATPase subunit